MSWRKALPSDIFDATDRSLRETAISRMALGNMQLDVLHSLKMLQLMPLMLRPWGFRLWVERYAICITLVTRMCQSCDTYVSEARIICVKFVLLIDEDNYATEHQVQAVGCRHFCNKNEDLYSP